MTCFWLTATGIGSQVMLWASLKSVIEFKKTTVQSENRTLKMWWWQGVRRAWRKTNPSVSASCIYSLLSWILHLCVRTSTVHISVRSRYVHIWIDIPVIFIHMWPPCIQAIGIYANWIWVERVQYVKTYIIFMISVLYLLLQ